MWFILSFLNSLLLWLIVLLYSLLTFFSAVFVVACYSACVFKPWFVVGSVFMMSYFLYPNVALHSQKTNVLCP